MEVATANLSIDAKQKIIDFCDKWIPIYEKRDRRYKLAGLTKRLRKAVRSHFKEREISVLAKLRPAWKQKMEAVERLSKADWITMHIFDLEEEQELLTTLFQPYYVEAGKNGAACSIRHLSGVLGRDVIYKGATIWIQNNAIKFGKKYANSVSKTTNERIRKQIAEAISQGEDLNKVMDRITKVYRAAEGYRSEMISRTEMGRAHTMSSLQQDKTFGLTHGDWFGCDSDCLICGPFMADNPHTIEELQAFRDETHPDCFGDYTANVPDDFVPNEVY